MASASETLRERVLDLAWSLWTGLGVPGQIDNHGDCVIDPEPLILFTAGLRDADSRLRDEATDWCIRYGQLISGTRLKNLLARESEDVRTGFGEFTATVARHSSLRWPGSTSAREHNPRSRLRIQTFTRPSQLVLRLRALMGIGARADIIRVFLGRPDAAFSTADLASEIGYTKRNAALALDMLKLGGILEAFPIRNQIHFRISGYNVERLCGLLGSMPGSFPRWSPLLRVLARTFEVAVRTERLAPKIRDVEAAAILRDLSDDIRNAGLLPPSAVPQGGDAWSAFMNWAVDIAK